jgi:hypothetical protein
MNGGGSLGKKAAKPNYPILLQKSTLEMIDKEGIVVE